MTTTLIWPKTGKELVQVPAGPFRYGEGLEVRELPTFWIARTPITNAEYKRFLDANATYPLPYSKESWAQPYNWDPETRMFPLGKAEHPVGLVDWYDALAYVEWAGGRVPTEEEWEKAARGDDGRRFPWGKWDVGRCNSLEAGVLATTPVEMYSPTGDSPYGCADMAGNVWEWTSSLYKDYPYRSDDGREDMSSGNSRVVRGGSFSYNEAHARAASRPHGALNDRVVSFGFRVGVGVAAPFSL